MVVEEKDKIKEKPYINLPNGKKISLAYLSRVANGEETITLEQLEKNAYLVDPATGRKDQS